MVSSVAAAAAARTVGLAIDRGIMLLLVGFSLTFMEVIINNFCILLLKCDMSKLCKKLLRRCYVVSWNMLTKNKKF
ncbi:MAG TPA: hypothetical protein VE692_02840, partial [Nitrososphaera sp.]|nr:hypothetical protein [Nitrososphaera sp.]